MTQKKFNKIMDKLLFNGKLTKKELEYCKNNRDYVEEKLCGCFRIRNMINERIAMEIKRRFS